MFQFLKIFKSLVDNAPCRSLQCKAAPPKATLGLRDLEGVAEGVHGGTVIVTMASRDRLHELHFGLATLG